jgi:protein phosphatase 2C-like protein
MRIRHATRPAPDRAVNEDLVLTGSTYAVVLDGATAPPHLDSGCEHDVRWLVGTLAAELEPLLDDAATSLEDLLATAIDRVRRRHGPGCDLDNPDSPSSTVTMLRATNGTVDYLVLADSPLVLRGTDGTVRVVTDDRLAGVPWTFEAVRERRNTPGGFWVASTAPEAAYQAVTGSAPHDGLDVAALLSDGASRWSERYGYSWPDLLGLLETDGPEALIDRVHEADRTAPEGSFRGKRYDDASAVFCSF